MAILWQKTLDNNRYEIRSAGRTRRLYTNGVCHSEYNPARVFTGSIWDLLILPAWFYPVTELRRILVLGVGGGSILLQLQRLLEPERVVGIDRDPVHLYLARRFFKLESAGHELIEADARDWLADYDGEAFDMIIDDLFIDDGDEPVRAVAVDGDWSANLLRHLRPGGLLTVNFGSREELTGSALFDRERYRRRFGSVFQVTAPMLDNHVGAFVGRCADSRGLRRRLLRDPVTERALGDRRIRYRIRQLV